MDTDDKDYFEARAEQEVRMAQEAGHSKAVQAHYQMADMYLDRVHGEHPDKPPPLIWGELSVANRENAAHFGTDPTRTRAIQDMRSRSPLFAIGQDVLPDEWKCAGTGSSKT